MVERKSNSEGTDDFFSSQMNFDLDDNKKMKKRRRRPRDGKRRSKPVSLREADFQKPYPKKTKLDHKKIPRQNDQIASCPGCGSDVNEGDFVDVIISFVTGAFDYLEGNPVRTQTIQSLRQQAKALDMPEPQQDWMLEICAKLEVQIQRSVDALRDGIRRGLEEELRRELVGEFYEHVRQEVEHAIRQEVESEMWEKFEEINRERNNQQD